MNESVMQQYKQCRGCSLRFPVKEPGDRFCRSCVNMGLYALPGMGGLKDSDLHVKARCSSCGVDLPGKATDTRLCPRCKHISEANRKNGQARRKVIYNRRCMQCGEMFRSRGARSQTCPACVERLKGKGPLPKIHCGKCGKLYWQENPKTRTCGRCKAGNRRKTLTKQ